MKNMNNKKIVAGVVALVIIIVAFIAFKVFTVSKSQQASVSITSVAFAKSIDAKGNPIGVSTTFNAAQDKQVYVVFFLKNATRKTTLAYARYLNDKFVDSKVMHPTVDGAANVYFVFEKGVGSYPKGNYRIVSYVNGQRSIEAKYIFQ